LAGLAADFFALGDFFLGAAIEVVSFGVKAVAVGSTRAKIRARGCGAGPINRDLITIEKIFTSKIYRSAPLAFLTL
jgi:hypothetical protein